MEVTIELPEGATLETANKIITDVWNEGYREKVKNKFPFLSESQLDGLYVNYEKTKLLTGSKKVTVYINVGITYKGEAEKSKEIIEYCGSIMEDAVNKYYREKK